MLVFQWLTVFVAVANAQDSLDLISQRRRAALATWPPPALMAQVPTWLSSQTGNGTWPDVDYRTGCDAQRANWPIQEHWNRVISFAAAWSGLNPDTSQKGNPAVLAAALKGLDWWFANDYTNTGCMFATPNAQCPCGTPGLWNTNWYGQVILIPQLVSTACVLLQPANLTQAEIQGCTRIPQRAYDLRDTNITGIGMLTGANTLSVMQNSASLALFTKNATMLKDALDRAMSNCVFSDTPVADGIHRDGSFLQHDGILYTGNYGKDLLNAFIQLQSATTGTEFAAGGATRDAIATYVRAIEWMLFREKSSGRLKWDYNTVGRFIAFPTADLQASADININTTLLVKAVGDFTGTTNVTDTLKRLTHNLTSPLEGNRAFYASDYMVHRRKDFTFANKMISTRSVNNEYTNSANPWGYFTGQGTLFTYVTGEEYKDIQAQWDWYLIPGTTALLHAPKLDPKWAGGQGVTEYVGVVSDGKFGISAMSYKAPHNGSLSFNKAWFYLSDKSVLVTTSNVAVSRDLPGIGDAPVVTVLENRAATSGGIKVDGRDHPSGNSTVSARTLWYGGNGYLSHGVPFALTLSEEQRSGNWSAISTSKLGVQTAKIFSAYTTIPAERYSYQVFPAISDQQLAAEAHNPLVVPVTSTSVLGAVSDKQLGLAFFPGSDLCARVTDSAWDIKVTVSAPVLVLVSAPCTRYVVTVADPTQRLATVSVSIDGPHVYCPSKNAAQGKCTPIARGVKFDVQLPTGGFAGASVTFSTSAWKV